MKQLKIFCVVIGLLLGAGVGFAQTGGKCGEDLTWSLEDGTLTISGSGKMTNFSNGSIPWNVRNIQSVVIQPGARSIGNFAFYKSSLTSVVIPGSMESIGDFAFSDCKGLASISVGKSLVSIGEMAFFFCSGLTSFDVDIDNPAYSSENGVLFNKLKDTLILCPAGKKNDYSIPESVISISTGAFLYCSGLTSIMIPSSVKSIGNEAFSDCYGLKSVVIPNSVKSIGYKAFYSCYGLTSAIIGNSVDSIGNYAFSECSDLASVTIGNSVEFIGDWAFSHCSGLKHIYLNRIYPPTVEAYTFGNIIASECTLHVPIGSKQNYLAVKDWKIFEDNIREEEFSAINVIASSDPIVFAQYYDLLGKVVTQPQQGSVYIVKEVYQSGKVGERKVIYR